MTHARGRMYFQWEMFRTYRTARNLSDSVGRCLKDLFHQVEIHRAVGAVAETSTTFPR